MDDRYEIPREGSAESAQPTKYWVVSIIGVCAVALASVAIWTLAQYPNMPWGGGTLLG